MQDTYISPTKQKSIDKIIKASKRLFHDRGIENTTIMDIAKKAKLTRPTVYTHFATKKDIVLRVLFEDFQTLYNFDYNLDQYETKLEKVKQFYHRNLDAYLANPNIMNFLITYYQTYHVSTPELEFEFKTLPNIVKVNDIIHSILDDWDLGLSEQDKFDRFYTIFNYVISIGMRYSLREGAYIGYEHRISKETLYKGIDAMIHIFDE